MSYMYSTCIGTVSYLQFSFGSCTNVVCPHFWVLVAKLEHPWVLLYLVCWLRSAHTHTCTYRQQESHYRRILTYVLLPLVTILYWICIYSKATPTWPSCSSHKPGLLLYVIIPACVLYSTIYHPTIYHIFYIITPAAFGNQSKSATHSSAEWLYTWLRAVRYILV